MNASTTLPAGATVLVVDDTPANLAVAVDHLEAQGLRVLVAEDGEEGVRRARFAVPDLILLDVMLPDMDGFETCRRLKAESETRDIPVIFMTALAGTPDKLAGFEVGAVDFLTKPFDSAEVLARVSIHLALRAAQRRLGAQNLALEREVEERRRAQAELQRAYDELKSTTARLTDTRRQLLQSEKMAAIGVLAGGLAHEINNPVGFVASNLSSLDAYLSQLLALIACYEAAEHQPAGSTAGREALRRAREEAELDFIREDAAKLVAESREGLDRVVNIVASLREFSRSAPPDWRLADLNASLEFGLRQIAAQLPPGASVRREYGEVPSVECSVPALKQVFASLLLNAVQAVAQGGEIAVRSGTDGARAWVEIADTGAGIAPEQLARVFDPFFTTRRVGEGLGLGLSVAYAIVKQHQGEIEVHSQVGEGTVVRVVLPLRQPLAAPTTAAVRRPRETGAMP